MKRSPPAVDVEPDVPVAPLPSARCTHPVHVIVCALLLWFVLVPVLDVPVVFCAAATPALAQTTATPAIHVFLMQPPAFDAQDCNRTAT
jgi:hypothetical protein